MKVKVTSDGHVRHGGKNFAPGAEFEFEGKGLPRLIANGTLEALEQADAESEPEPVNEPEMDIENEESPDYEAMTVPVLRELLAERGLDSEGLKADLIERLEQADAE